MVWKLAEAAAYFSPRLRLGEAPNVVALGRHTRRDCFSIYYNTASPSRLTRIFWKIQSFFQKIVRKRTQDSYNLNCREKRYRNLVDREPVGGETVAKKTAKRNPPDEALLRPYSTLEEARAAAKGKRGVRPYHLSHGDFQNYILAKNADIAKSRFFDVTGGTCEPVSAKPSPRTSRARLQHQLEGLRTIRSQMTGKTKDAQAQQAVVDREIESLEKQLAAVESELQQGEVAPVTDPPPSTGEATAPAPTPEPPAPAPAPAPPVPPMPA